MRQKLIDSHLDEHGALLSLAGLDDADSWTLRESFLSRRVELDALALGTAGVFGDRAGEYRLKLLEAGASPDYVAHSLVFDDSDSAWRLRKHLMGLDTSPSWVALGLAQIFSEKSFRLRSELVKSGAELTSVIFGINGDYLTGGLLPSVVNTYGTNYQENRAKLL